MQCNIISLTGILQYITTFVTVGCRQMKVLKNCMQYLEFLIHMEYKKQEQQVRGLLQK